MTTAIAKPHLIVLGGLPGTGKTTIARLLARRTGAVHLRIDSIEQALLASGLTPAQVGAAGYIAAQRLAVDNLLPGRSVIADCVNPVQASREGWRAVATETGAAFMQVELVCTDAAAHRRRIETRHADIPGHLLPDWSRVMAMAKDYEPWPADLVIDTAMASAETAAARITAVLATQR